MGSFRWQEEIYFLYSGSFFPLRLWGRLEHCFIMQYWLVVFQGYDLIQWLVPCLDSLWVQESIMSVIIM